MLSRSFTGVFAGLFAISASPILLGKTSAVAIAGFSQGVSAVFGNAVLMMLAVAMGMYVSTLGFRLALLGIAAFSAAIVLGVCVSIAGIHDVILHLVVVLCVAGACIAARYIHSRRQLAVLTAMFATGYLSFLTAPSMLAEPASRINYFLGYTSTATLFAVVGVCFGYAVLDQVRPYFQPWVAGFRIQRRRWAGSVRSLMNL